MKKEARYQRDLEEERVRNEAQLRILEQQVAAVEAKRADERSEREQEAIRYIYICCILFFIVYCYTCLFFYTDVCRGYTAE